jgi:pimeloyl-ACP methyl ester carboxylesterase
MGEREATAGFRNAGWTMGQLPAGTSVSVHPLRTADGAAVNGFLYAAGPSDVVACIMHPREFLASHYLVPELLVAGYSVFTQTSRSVGSDLRLEHEIALSDVAAGLCFLKENGFKRIVLIGNSGGASLYTFYNQQSLRAPGERLQETTGGRPTGLAKLEMPQADGIILVSPHPGQGVVLMNCIDPSVVDETDPLAIDPTLDPLDPENGYAPAPEGARYDLPFVTKYRAAQRDRVARLDAVAKSMIEQRLAARKRARDGGSRADRINGAHTGAMTIWRTDADLRCWDPTLDPSERAIGSIWSNDPYSTNFGVVGFARFCTPEAWLSTWSGLSSRANMFETARSIEQPMLLIEYSGDQVVFPADVQRIFDVVPSKDRTRKSFRGDHHGQPLAAGEQPGRTLAGEAIREWLADRFPRLEGADVVDSATGTAAQPLAIG